MTETLFILGAGRSGTNLLRDILTTLPGLGTWPCDEINYIWRHGNLGAPDDEFGPERATPAVRRYIHGRFDAMRRSTGAKVLVEKTCANTLRVPFLHALFPEARYLHIIRDGRDVAASAMARWTAPLDLGYALRKARFIPLGDLPYYVLKQGGNRLRRLWSREGRLSYWGPRPRGIEFDATTPLEVICARQWRGCVEKAEQDLARLAPERTVTIRYEELVRDPRACLEDALGLLGDQYSPASLDTVSISGRSVGRWKTVFDPAQQRRIDEEIGDVLARLGYT